MENKKNKKKLFAIIGASALAFILTVALSVSITLAYFGQAGSGNATLSTGGSVLVSTPATFSSKATGLIPGQKVTMDIEANVKSSSTQDAYLVAVVGTDEDGSADMAGLVTGSLATGWVEIGTATGTHAGTVYLYGSATAATKISATEADQKIALTTGTVTVPTSWKNDKADSTVTITVTFVAIQTPVGTDGAKLETVKYADMLTILGNVDTGTTFAVKA